MKELTLEEKKEKRIIIGDQYAELASQGIPSITCGCGRKIKILHMYRCFFCGEYYCPKCAKEHFE